MKATMNERGVITLQPENSMEAFALECWAEKSYVTQDEGTNIFHTRRLIVETNVAAQKEAGR